MKCGSALNRLRKKMVRLLEAKSNGVIDEEGYILGMEVLKMQHLVNYHKALELENRRERHGSKGNGG